MHSTFATRDEAISAARALLEARLIACANIIDGATSLYRWEGKLHQEQESILLAKTSKSQLDAAIIRLKEIHPYELPAIVAYPAQAHAPYAQWVTNEASPA